MRILPKIEFRIAEKRKRRDKGVRVERTRRRQEEETVNLGRMSDW